MFEVISDFFKTELTNLASIDAESFTEASFAWYFPALEYPRFVLLNKGNVTFSGVMKPNQEETAYTITLVRIRIINYSAISF